MSIFNLCSISLALFNVHLLEGLPLNDNISLQKPIFFSVVGGLQEAIVNGHQCSVEEGKYLVQVRQEALFYQTFCGGSLIAPKTVLTAAHCINRFLGSNGLHIRYGTKKLSKSNYSDISVSSVHIHPNYDNKLAQNDIAVLTLAEPVTQDNNVRYIKLASKELPENSVVSVYGWGKVSGAEFGGQAEHLQKVNLTTWSVKNCNEARNSAGLPDNDNVICANSPVGIACQGDSGGPMVAKNQLVGLASEVQDGCPPGGLNVYTKITAYRDFIRQHTV